jgi:hypothetical protein
MEKDNALANEWEILYKAMLSLIGEGTVQRRAAAACLRVSTLKGDEMTPRMEAFVDAMTKMRNEGGQHFEKYNEVECTRIAEKIFSRFCEVASRYDPGIYDHPPDDTRL